ncbi:ankyrin repeat and SOCS box protein 2 [Austrofundulus limnaeus]|uniref:Ankyrin repeat and SOCS box protein 2 n=1 Tax=Austrofundulus limnaeus TaxID=52670 RepID=A0A2I4CDQ3_AUSLI|nr:PREDICTED: ankyrin repeat and SOCS box protein 2-like [Austrofundulus limnaeus]
MAVSEADLEDYSLYSHMSDDELLQIAVERSLTDKHNHPGSSSMLSALTPEQTHVSPDQPKHPLQVPPFQSQEPTHVPNSANPPTALSQFLYKASNSECSPLLSIIKNGDAEALMDLVRQRSSSLTEPNDEGWIALHEAAYYGQLQCVRVLIRADPGSVNKCTLKKQTALLLAALRGNVSCVEFLLKHGANVNAANKDRETPLFTACENPNEDVVDLLLAHGAQVNLTCRQGGSALHEACRCGRPNLCQTLLDAGANVKTKNLYNIQPFFTAAQHGHTEILQLLAQRGADINGPAGDGATPLYEACKNGHVGAVQTLLDLKADPNQATKSGLLPLHVAVKNNHQRIVQLLIPVTSRVRVQSCGISPLHIAAEKNRDDIMEQMIESGFDVNAELSDERSKMYMDRRTTALYFSVFNGNLDIAEMLLQAGANPNLDTFNPLLIAVRLGRKDLAELLVRYGADVNAQMSTQPSSFPSAILLSMDSPAVLKLLLDNGCDARLCFDCTYGLKPHPVIAQSRRPIEELRINEHMPAQHCIQYCEAISSSSISQISGPIISMLLDYVGHVQLCSRLLEILDSRSDWTPIKLKAFPPHPLMQLCRLKIRYLVGVQRLRLIHTLPLPVRLISFLRYDMQCSLT